MIKQKNPLGTVAYVGRGALAEEFVWAWTQLVQYTNERLLRDGNYVHWERGAYSGQDETRNTLAKRMQGDWLLMIDADHTFEPDLVERMLRVFNGHDLSVLTALYQYRVPPYNPVIYGWDDEAGYRYIIPSDLTHTSPPFLIDCAGAGTLMIRRRVFEKIEVELKEKPFERYPPWSEDFAFFQRLAKLKVQTWCAPTIRTFHLKVSETHMHEFDPGGLQFVKQQNVAALA